MSNDGAGRRPGADTEGRRSDFTKALVGAGIAAAIVIAVVAPASRTLRPSTLLEDAVAVNVAVRSVDDAPQAITSSARRDRRATTPASALALDIAPTVAAGPTSECVACVSGDRPPKRSDNPASGTAAAARPADRPDPGKAAEAQAPGATPENDAVTSPTPPAPEKRPNPKPAPSASDAASKAPGHSGEMPAPANENAAPPADDRPGNDAPPTSDDRQKKAKP